MAGQLADDRLQALRALGHFNAIADARIAAFDLIVQVACNLREWARVLITPPREGLPRFFELFLAAESRDSYRFTLRRSAVPAPVAALQRG
jgi:hypothetical protein